MINAIEAMPMNKGELKLFTKYTDGKSSIEVCDNGKGISEADVKKIFEPYFTNRPGGMGLGLSATMDILLANHVNVDIRSQEGAGTCFTFSFDNSFRI